MEGPTLVASARLEEGIPKLLVKVSPATAANSTKNLGEVTLRKLGAPVEGRSHVAVVHLSAAVPTGVVLISTKLAELLGVTNGEQVQIARSERVSRRGSKEDTDDRGVRSQSKHAGSLPPESRQSIPWTESPLFAQGRSEQHRRTVHGGRILGTPQAKVAEELPEYLNTPPRGYVPRTMASVASQQGFHHPPMPVAASPRKVANPKTPMPSPASPAYHPYFPQSAGHSRVPNPCNSPGLSVRMTRVPQPANFSHHMARPKIPPAVQSARMSTGGAASAPCGYSHGMCPRATVHGVHAPFETQAEAADWLPASSCMGATWQATQRQVPPSSPPALIPKTHKAESRSPSPPHTPAKSSPTQARSPTQQVPSRSPQHGQPPLARARTQTHPVHSPKFFTPTAPFSRSISDGDKASPSPPLLPRRVDVSPQLGTRSVRQIPQVPLQPQPRVERRFSLPAEHSAWFAAQDVAAAMAPVPPDRPTVLPAKPPPLIPMVQPPPPAEPMVPRTVTVETEPGAARVGPPLVDPTMADSRRGSHESTSVQEKLVPERCVVEDAPAAGLVENHVEEKPLEAEVLEDGPPVHRQVSNQRRASKMALVPVGRMMSDGRNRPKHLALGALQCDTGAGTASYPPVLPLNDWWRPPNKSAGGTLERSELGSEITAEVRRWLKGQTSGLQCSHVVMDKALTVLSNFKLSSGCELEVLGGPLGAIIGGYNEEDWLYKEIFSKDPGQALQDAFQLLGFPSDVGDWSGFMVEEISLAYRRQCLRGHPSRGGPAQHYLKLQVAMELVRAFDQDRSSATAESPEVFEGGDLEAEAAWSPMTRRKRKVHGFVLDDLALVRELELSQTEAALEADTLPAERLEELNRALDEYILRQMCFKSEIVAEIARLHENSAYSILGVSPEASDAEIKKAYRLVAMQCHPDKGGDKAEFQELHEAYEKIMEQRRSSANLAAKSGGGSESSPEKADVSKPKEEEDKTEKAEAEEEVEEEEETEEKVESDHGDEDGGDVQLLAKSAKAAEEASRYAKTAADFAHQAAEAAETARQGRDGGNALALTKSIAHSAIVLTLTVVKAVRVVGYATMDVAAQCRLAARKFSDSGECAECSTEAMTLGLEALNAALSCAEVTEVTAAELSREASAEEADAAAAERFIGAAVRASLAAASASNAAMSAAIAAVEGNRQCIQAAQPAEEAKDPKPSEDEEEKSVKSEDETARSDHSEPKASGESPEDQGLKRQINQRSNNHKVLLRLNAEILLHQQNVRQFLQANRQLIPEVSCEARDKVQTLLHDYAHEVQLELEALSGDLLEEIPNTLKHSGLLAPMLQRQVLAIPVCPKARVLKMAALYDLQMTFQVLEQEIFEPARQMLLKAEVSTQSLDEVTQRIQQELRGYTDGG